MSLYIRKRILKTLARFKFKAENHDSHIYGYFQPVKNYKNNNYITYELDKFKIIVYANGNINFYYLHNLQAVVKSFFRISLIGRVDYLNNILDECDLITNNDTR